MIEFLKKLYGDDYDHCLHPIDRRMKIIDDFGIEGMSTENTRFLINELVRLYAKTYLEVGSFKGSTIISASVFNENVRCISIDNFSEFDGAGTNNSVIQKNIIKANVSNIECYNADYKDAIKDIFSNEPELKIDIYFYDGNHSYENQLNGLNVMLPHLSSKCIIFVDDINWDDVKNANNVWLSENPEFKCHNIFTEANSSKTWWNGFSIIYRGILFDNDQQFI